MLGCVINGAARNAHQPAERRAVDDRTACLLPHVAQLVLHAVPDAAQIDRVHAIEFFAACISGFRDRAIYARVVERRIQAAEGRHGQIDHCLDLRLIGHVALHGNGFVTCCDELRGSQPGRRFVHVDQDDSRASLRECLRSGPAHARAGAGDKRDLAFERVVHLCLAFSV